MADYTKVKMNGNHAEALRYLDDGEQLSFYESLEFLRTVGKEARCMDPIARIMLHWVMSDNGIDPIDVPVEESEAG